MCFQKFDCHMRQFVSVSQVVKYSYLLLHHYIYKNLHVMSKKTSYIACTKICTVTVDSGTRLAVKESQLPGKIC